MAKIMAAIETADDVPMLLVNQLAEREREVAAMRAQVKEMSRPRRVVSAKEHEALIASLGGVPALLAEAEPAEKAEIYADLGLFVEFDAAAQSLAVSVSPRGEGIGGVRRGT